MGKIIKDETAKVLFEEWEHENRYIFYITEEAANKICDAISDLTGEPWLVIHQKSSEGESWIIRRPDESNKKPMTKVIDDFKIEVKKD